MKILVMGSGGVGGYFGGRLAGAGNEVTFIARGAHLAAIQREGLKLDSQIGALTVNPASAVAEPGQMTGKPEIVLFATKLGDTESAARSLAPVATPGTTIITFQNGIDGADMIAKALPGVHVVPGVARIASRIAQPGVIEQRGPFAEIEFGERNGKANPRLEAFLAACKAAGITAAISPDINRSLWEKLAFLAAFSGMTTLTGHTAGPLRENPATRSLIEDAVREAIAVGRAAGVALQPDEFERRMQGFDRLPPAMTSSMAHDRHGGKPLEVNYLSGAIVRLGEGHGVATPTHRFIVQALAIDAAGKGERPRP
jgi:2-dehydropantoate 2-reductase